MLGKSVSIPAILLMVSIAAIVNAVPTPYYALTLTNDGSHNLYAGSRETGDRLFLRQPAFKPSAGQYTIHEVVYAVGRWETITMVKALDQEANNSGAFPIIVSGGPGYNSVKLRFESQRYGSINFIVELYSVPAKREDSS